MDDKESKNTPQRTTASLSQLPDDLSTGGILQSPSRISNIPRSPVKGQSLVALYTQAHAKDKTKDKECGDTATTATRTKQREYVASPQKHHPAAVASASPAQNFATPSGSLNAASPRRKTLVERAVEFPAKDLQPSPSTHSTSAQQRKKYLAASPRRCPRQDPQRVSKLGGDGKAEEDVRISQCKEAATVDQREYLMGRTKLTPKDEHRLDWNKAVEALQQKHKDEVQCMQKRHQEELEVLRRQYGADMTPK